MSDNESTIVQRHLERLQNGDRSVRDALLACVYTRLQGQAQRMLRQFPGVRRWEDTDDISNKAALRLWKGLEEAKPTSARHFYRLAALQVRRELLDLARRYSGPQGLGANHESVAQEAKGDSHVVADPSDHSHNP